jgi:hypothetical protein
MIEYSNNNPNRHYCYFAGEGSYGDASDIVVIDVAELDSHWASFIEEVSDWQRPDFMRWFVDNQTHYQESNSYTDCQVCYQWNSGLTEDEIIAELESEKE